jgi:site-specific recombinase XerD
MRQAPTSPDGTAAGDLQTNAASFRRHLRAENISPNTVLTYTSAVALLADYLGSQGMPSDVAKIRREHIEAFIADLLEHWKPATANNRFRGCQRFFNWLVEEGEIKTSPMARMRPPRIPEQPAEVLRIDELRKLLTSCNKDTSFTGRRDYALLRILIDTGIRRAEIAGLRWRPDDETTNDVDLEQAALRVMGNGRRERVVHIGV